MTSAHDGCPDIKVMPTPAGAVLLVGPAMTQAPPPVTLVTALGTPAPADGRLVHLVEERPFSPITQRFFQGQPYLDSLVVVPGTPGDAQSLADFLGVQVQVPPHQDSDRTPGRLPVDASGLVTDWETATAIRVLPRRQVAAREAFVEALQVAAGPEPPSWQRLAGLQQRIPAVLPPATWAAAVYLARFGPPAGLDPATLTRSALPMTMARLQDLLGAEAIPAAGTDVRAGLLTGDIKAVLVLAPVFLQASPQPTWIFPDGDRLRRVAPGDGSPLTRPEEIAGDILSEILNAAGTHIVAVPRRQDGPAVPAATEWPMEPEPPRMRQIAEMLPPPQPSRARQITDVPPASPEPETPELPGFYATRPDLLALERVDTSADVWRRLSASIAKAVHERRGSSPLLPHTLDLSDIKAMFDNELGTFTRGGRSFDVRHSRTGGWFRVTVAAVRRPGSGRPVDGSGDKAKHDTRTEHQQGARRKNTVAAGGSLGFGFGWPKRLGPGFAVRGEVLMSRPAESIGRVAETIDSRNVRSGKASWQLRSAIDFTVSVSEARVALPAADSTPGDPVRATGYFRIDDDIALATTRPQTEIAVPVTGISHLKDYLSPTAIVSARLNDAEASASWNDTVETILSLLAPSKAVGPGTVGAKAARDQLGEASILGMVLPALDGPVHPPSITSPHDAHSLALRVEGSAPAVTALADIAKSTFRLQPGQNTSTTTTHESQVGPAVSLVPVRYSMPGAYVQAKVFFGFSRLLSASEAATGQTRAGAELKDVANVLVTITETLKFTPALRERPFTRLPYTAGGAPGAFTVEVTTVGRLPLNRLPALLTGAGTLVREPGVAWHVPPWAYTGGPSITRGLDGFAGLRADVDALVRRFPGGFLPRYDSTGRTALTFSSGAARRRERNQAELDRVVSAAGLTQNQKAVLARGHTAVLSRRRWFRDRHLVVDVSGHYTGGLTHQGTERDVAVRATTVSGTQHRVVVGRQVRMGVALEGGAVVRFLHRVSAALSPSAGVEVRMRERQRSGARFGGEDLWISGGTPHSEVFAGRLTLRVDVYAYRRRFLGRDRRSRLGLGRRVVRKLEPRQDFTTPAIVPKHVPGPAGQDIPRYRLEDTGPVLVLVDQSSRMPFSSDYPVTFEPRPDPLGVRRNTSVERDNLRDWVDGAGTVTLASWLSVLGLPAAGPIRDLATAALRDTQHYPDRDSRTKLHGLRGADALLPGMPLWSTLQDRLSPEEQITGLPRMLGDRWDRDKITPGDEGATTDLAVLAGLTNPDVLQVYGTIGAESGISGMLAASGSAMREGQVAARVAMGTNVRRTAADSTFNGGGAQISGEYERLLWSRSTEDSETVGAAIERITTNRKGTVRSVVVKFDLVVTAAIEVTTEPDKYAALPHALHPRRWRHTKSARRDGIVRNAIYLRLPADEADRLGLLRRLPGDTGTIDEPWRPADTPRIRLAPGLNIGMGLQRPVRTPDLTRRLIDGLKIAADVPADSTIWGSDEAAEAGRPLIRAMHAALTAPGLDDAMLNRRRLNYASGPDGIARFLASQADGGIGVLYMEAGRFTQGSRELRLYAEPAAPPTLLGFLADHQDLDIRNVHVDMRARKEQQSHGDTLAAGVAATGVSNSHRENIAAGAGDSIAYRSRIDNAQESGGKDTVADMSSGRGIKGLVETRVRFSLTVFDRGVRIGAPLWSAEDIVVQNRWAGELRPPRPRDSAVRTPASYVVSRPATLPPGWLTSNGLPLPPRYTAENLTGLGALQAAVATALAGEASRLAKAGYAGAYELRQQLTPDMLLPGVPAMLGPRAYTLPAVTSAQVLGGRARITVRMMPESASLGDVSTGVYREHIGQHQGDHHIGTDRLDQTTRQLQVPLVGRGFPGDPYQPLETGGTGAGSGDMFVADETSTAAAAVLDNVKPESRSVAVDYLGRIEVTLALPRRLRNGLRRRRVLVSPQHPARRVIRPAGYLSRTKIVLTSKPGDRAMVRLRMSLADARIALNLPTRDAAAAAPPSRVAEFDRLVAHEAGLDKAAAAFVNASEALNLLRYEGLAVVGDARAAAGEKLAGLLAARDRAGEAWWVLAQEQQQLIHDYRHRHLGISPLVTRQNERLALARTVRRVTLETVAPERDSPPPLPPLSAPAPALAPAPVEAALAPAPAVEPPTTEMPPTPGVLDPAVVTARVHGVLKTGSLAVRAGAVLVIGRPHERLRQAVIATPRNTASPLILVDGDGLGRWEKDTGWNAAPGPEQDTGEAKATVAGARVRDIPDLTVLGSALHHYHAAGARPVVVSTGLSGRLTRLLRAYNLVTVTAVPRDEVGVAWRLSTSESEHAELDRALAEAPAGRGSPLPVAPAVLTGWLAAPDWPAAASYLREHREELHTPQVSAALAGLVAAQPDNRELAAYHVVLELSEPSRSEFAVRYLTHVRTVEQRSKQDDELLFKLYEEQLTAAQTVNLVRGLVRDDPAQAGRQDPALVNALVFGAIGATLRLPSSHTEAQWGEVLRSVAGCPVPPMLRYRWVLRSNQLRERLRADSKEQLAVLVGLLVEKVTAC